MPVGENAQRALDEALGTDIVDAELTADSAPNGYNLVGAMKTIRRILREQQEWERGGITGLPDEKQQELAEAQEDFQYYLDVLRSFGEDVQGQDGAFEVDGTVFDLPRSASHRGFADQVANATGTENDTGESPGLIERFLNAL